MFRGNAPARIDDKGRLKVPNAFRSLLETKYGRELFLTSLTGEYVRVYPMPVWPTSRRSSARCRRRIRRSSASSIASTTSARRRARYTGPRDHPGAPARRRDDDGRRRRAGPVQLPRRLEPRSLPHQAAARAVHRRRRARSRSSAFDGARARDDGRSAPVPAPERGGLFVDCTVGLGGHTRAARGGRHAHHRPRSIWTPWPSRASRSRPGPIRVELVHADYRAIDEVLDRRQIDAIDGALADLGVSSMQFDAPGRGFSFQRDEPLDMRMDRSDGRHRGGSRRPLQRRASWPTRSSPTAKSASRAASPGRSSRRAAKRRSTRPAGWRPSCGGRFRGAGRRASIRPRARFRRFASG